MYTYDKYKDFIKYLDGEFVIVLFDFNKNKLYISGDIFKTKPLFYKLDDNIIISSYLSSCNDIKKQDYNQINPNETLIFDLSTRNLIERKRIYDFDLRQYKNSYSDYIKAFERSVLKRYPEASKPLITLSSGLDSGAISACLHKYNKDALYLSIPKNEDINVMRYRKNILKDKHLFVNITEQEKLAWKSYLYHNCNHLYGIEI